MKRFDFDGHKLFYQFETTYRLLTDQFISPVYVEYSPVGNCNHRCIFCAYDYIGYQSRRLDRTKTLESIKAFAQLGVKAMLFAGEGEPLLHKEIDDFFITAYEHGVSVGVYTNGVLLTPQRVAKVLDKLAFVRISLNAGTKESYQAIHRCDDFDRVIKNIIYAVDFKRKNNITTDIGLQFVVIPENLDTLIPLAKLGADLGVDYLAIKPFVQHGHQEGYHFEQNFALNEIEPLLNEAVTYSHDHYQVIARKESFLRYHHRTYDRCYALPLFGVILSDGNVYSCGPHLGNERFCYGNLYQESIPEMMCSSRRMEIINFAKHYLDCKKGCMPNCRLDAINRSLWELKHPTVKHVNFI